MTTRQWKLVVTEIGTSVPAAEAVVEAPNWMAGIKAARGKIGEAEAIPQGASCTVAPDGRVTVFDAARRRSYVLTPLSGGASADDAAVRMSAPTPAAVASSPFAVQPAPLPMAAPPTAAPLPAAPAPQAARARPKTMAYILDGPLPSPANLQPVPVGTPARPSQVDSGRPDTQSYATEGRPTAASMPAAMPAPVAAPAPQPAPAPAPEPAPSGRALRRTMAFVPGQFDLPPLPTREVVVGARPTAAPAEPQRASEVTQALPVAGRPSAASVPTAEPFRVLFERSMPPSDESPLHYHLVGIHASADRSTLEYERAMHAELDRVRRGIPEPRDGHFVQVFVYREALTEPVEDAEVARLQWRGWRAESVVRFPKLEAQVAAQTIPGAERYPTAATDPRLDDLLDAFEDVWFLATPGAGLEFVARVLTDLFPDAHVLCAGLSLDGRAFVPSSVHGSLAGYAAPDVLPHTGLVQLALAGAGRPVSYPDPAADGRIDVASEGIGTGPLLAAVAPHAGEALAYVRVARAKASPPFTLVDAEILRAVVERLGLYLRLRGACLVQG